MKNNNAIAAAIIIAGGGISLSLALLANATHQIFGGGGEVVGVGMLIVGSVLLYTSLFNKADRN